MIDIGGTTCYLETLNQENRLTLKHGKLLVPLQLTNLILPLSLLPHFTYLTLILHLPLTCSKQLLNLYRLHILFALNLY